MIRPCLYLICLICLAGQLAAAEYFVSPTGNDDQAGNSLETAFATIQRGVDALAAGDTLWIGPGEYRENVVIEGLGEAGVETRIAALLPHTVILRGDREAELTFQPVPGRRFVHVADSPDEVLSVHEVDTLSSLKPAVSISALEFGPGRYLYDAKAGKLYVSTTDFQPPGDHHFSLGTRRGSGVLVRDSDGVVLDGLVVRGFRTPVDKAVLTMPVSGFMIHQSKRCVVRHAIAFFNGSGMTIQNDESGGHNVIADSRSYANREGMVAYHPSGEVIRDSLAFANDLYGARFYGTRRGEELCLFQRLIAWGHPGGDYWFKGWGLSGETEFAKAEQCVAFRDVHIAQYEHGVVGGRTRRGILPTTIDLPSKQDAFLAEIDRLFADPLNGDFRPQATAEIQLAGEPGGFRGPYPLPDDVFYVSPDGDDANSGLAMDQAWRSLDHAVGQLRPGATLYLGPGDHELTAPIAVKNVSIRGRGLATPRITGSVAMRSPEDVSWERLRFAGQVHIVAGRNLSFSSCEFAGDGPLRVEGTRDLLLQHNLLEVPLHLLAAQSVSLIANRFPARRSLVTDQQEALAHRSHNSFGDEEVMGPFGFAAGPYREWQQQTLRLEGPEVHSVTDTTLNLEWWTSLPAEVELSWGTTPDCPNRETLVQTAYYNHSLTGLKPDTRYYVKLRPVRLLEDADPAHRYLLPEAEATMLTIRTAGDADREPRDLYVAPDGDDLAAGTSRQAAWQTLQYAVDQLKAGDTLWLAEGTYSGTVYFRETGTPERPISLRALPGERVTIDGKGETLTVGFVLYGKHGYRFDRLYFNGFAGIPDNRGGAECGALLVRGGSDLQVTRCHFSYGWGPGMVAEGCPDILVEDCVFMHSMSSTSFTRCPGLEVHHNVFISPLIHHLMIGNREGETASVTHNIFGENTRGKVHIPFTGIGPAQANNCFYTRWPTEERPVIMGYRGGGVTLPEYQALAGDHGSISLDPYLAGIKGFKQGWMQGNRSDFDKLFASHPEVVRRGIGLRPASFDFEDWPYDQAWAAEFLRRHAAAESVSELVALVASMPMDERLKSDLLEQASRLAQASGDWEQAMALAVDMPVESLSKTRQMELLFEQEKWTELIETFHDRPGHGKPYLSWILPQTEAPLADAMYYRGMAYAHTGDLDKAEEDLRLMIEKSTKLSFSPGDFILCLTWLRLGHFYRDWRQDPEQALQAYREVLRTEAPDVHGRMRQRPPSLGDSEIMERAAAAAAAILRQQGKEEAALDVEYQLLTAKARAAVHLDRKDEAMQLYAQAAQAPGASPEERAACDQQREELGLALWQEMHPDPSIQDLIAASQHDNTLIRRQAVEALVTLETKDEAVLKTVLEALRQVTRDEDEDLRLMAHQVLLQARVTELEELAKRDQWQAILEAVGKEDVTVWPIADLAGEALLWRARAHQELGELELAHTDLTTAVELAPGNVRLWSALATLYEDHLDDQNKALAAYLQAHQLLGPRQTWWLSYDLALRTAALLQELGRPQEGLDILQAYDLEAAPGSWRSRLETSIAKLKTNLPEAP